MSDTPQVSVIMLVGHQRERAESALTSLLGQTGLERCEILVWDSAPESHPPIAGSDQPPVRVVVPASRRDFGRMKAEAVRLARGEVVLFLEEHVQVAPGWLEAMAGRFDGSWVAVGPCVENANPDVGLSKIMALLNYGLWTPPVGQGEVSLLPGNNSAYQRQALLDLGDDLASLLVSDTVLQWTLMAKGGRLFLEAEAAIRHLNPTTLANCLKAEFTYHWPFAGIRAQSQGWSRWKSLRYLLLSPAIPWLRLRRSLALNAEKGMVPPWKLLRHLPHLVLMFHAAVLGQIMGLLFGPSRGVELFTAFELNSSRPAKGA